MIITNMRSDSDTKAIAVNDLFHSRNDLTMMDMQKSPVILAGGHLVTEQAVRGYQIYAHTIDISPLSPT